jgi:hypothetical protein
VVKVSTIGLAASIFVCLFGAAVLEMLIRGYLPGHHLDDKSQDAVKLGMGLVATMSALVLGLLVASAKSSYDRQNGEVRQIAANISQLDRVLADYGRDTVAIRDLLHRTVAHLADEVWAQGASRSAVLGDKKTDTGAWAIRHRIQALAPFDEGQRDLRALALQLTVDLARSRWRLVAEEGSAIPLPFLIILVFWLTVLFASFGLFAPKNATVVATLLVGTLSVAGAIFLILELDRPFDGVMRISADPIIQTLELATRS